MAGHINKTYQESDDEGTRDVNIVVTTHTDVPDEVELNKPNGVVSGILNGGILNENGLEKTRNATMNDTEEEKDEKDKRVSNDNEMDEKEDVSSSVSIAQLLRFAKAKDRLMIAVGVVCAICHGITFEILIIIIGDLIDEFVGHGKYVALVNSAVGNGTVPSALEAIKPVAFNFTIAGCCVIPLAYGQFTCFLIASRRQAHAVRVALFRAILKQDIGWFDTHQVAELNHKLETSVHQIEDGIGDKAAVFIQLTSTLISSVIIALYLNWKLSLVVISLSPIFVGAMFFINYVIPIMNRMEMKAYEQAGAVAQEVLSAIKTVVAFGGEEKERNRYNSKVEAARRFGVKKAVFFGLGISVTSLSLYFGYALAFWYGSRLSRAGEVTAGDIITIFLCLLTGLYSVGGGVGYFQELAQARNAAASVWQWIDKVPTIDVYSSEGLKPDRIKGDIEFNNVTFTYPSRPDVKVLNDLSSVARAGQTVALVGASGSGKSTVIQLLQRFYDPLEGSVSIDGNDVRALNVAWLRRNMGVVSQEPVLFATTIAENIRYGRESATDDDVKTAAQKACVHDFIMSLPQDYNTLVGERGAQLSGGQKQRIAIARALVRDPKILLLDEATSALDNDNEALVQAALDLAFHNRTTIVVAHRLSTIRTADHIIAMEEGRVVETGNHTELMNKQGVYHQLVTSQSEETEDQESINELGRIEVRKHSARTNYQRSESKVSALDQPTAADKFEKNEDNISMKRLLKLNSSEWSYILLGCFLSLILGAQYPAYGLLLSEAISTFSIIDLSEQEKEINKYALIMFCIGIAVCAGTALQRWAFGVVGEWLTMRIRKLTFSNYLHQDMAFFDDVAHETGKLTARLATDASVVHGATWIRVAALLQTITSLCACVIVAFVYCWQLSLLMIATVPLTIATGYIKLRVLRGQLGKGHGAVEECGKVATETMFNMRTVASLSIQQHLADKYSKLTRASFGWFTKDMHLPGFAYGLTQGLLFFTLAVTFYFGTWLIDNEGYSFLNVFKVFAVLVIATRELGREGTTIPDFTKAKLAASRMFKLLDHVPSIRQAHADKKILKHVTGLLEFKNVHFSYPSRPTVPVLIGLNLQIEPGQTVALVGCSGCGKSTVLQLLQRFYTENSGKVLLDGVEARSLDLDWLRAQFGVVFQEPTLFNCTIRENIAYGDTTRTLPMSEIISSARKANIHDFISSLPQGYETLVGERGTQLSGGQKQRISIARALVRDPKILLLDEATSALDTESEKVVQDALDRAMVGRTSIVIAHRLSTIQNADHIILLNNGKEAEQGTHAQLMAKKGYYYKFHQTNM